MIIRACWIVLALIHALPALALFRPALLTQLYGVEAGSTVHLLLHHRAALFLVIVVVCLFAIFRPETRQLATVALAVTMLAFLALYAGAGSPPALRTIAIADLAGLPFVAYAGWQAFRTGPAA